MKKIILLFICFLSFLGMKAQNFLDPWTPKQLLSTQVLAARINQNKMSQTVVINIGPDAVIKGSFNLGPVQDKGNREKLINYLSKVPKDKEVVLYCGCCPFEKCPNIRPAFNSLIAMGYKNTKLLNIPKNIKVDWINKGYPVN